MNRLQVNFPFFVWLPTFSLKKGMQNVFSIPSINAQTNLQKIWHFSNGSTLSSVHPPADDLKILLKGEPILATPFRKGWEGNDTVKVDDLKKVHQQANYTYTILQTIAEQLNQVSIQIAEAKRKQTTTPSTSHQDSVSKPFFKTECSKRKNGSLSASCFFK